MLDKILNYYKNKKIYLLILIFVISIFTYEVPSSVKDGINLSDDPPQGYVLVHDSTTSVVGTFTGTPINVYASYPYTQFHPIKNININGDNIYVEAEFIKDNLTHLYGNQEDIKKG